MDSLRLLAERGLRALALIAPLALVSCGPVASVASGDPADPGPRSAPDAATARHESALRVVPASRSLRIAIVGAGASGLTAANTLRELGYAQVTVFEKETRVGGKVFSDRSGDAVTELGAVLASPDNELVLRYAHEHQVPYVVYDVNRTFVDAEGVARSPQGFLRTLYRPLPIALATWRYAAALDAFTTIDHPGLDLAAPGSDLDLPFDVFAESHHFTPIAELVRAPMIGFGYGYFETTPALYYMKMMRWLVQPSLLRGPIETPAYVFPTGFQTIWERVAEGLDVRLDAEVTEVVRPSPSGAPVRLTVNGAQTFDFDELVISAPLHRVGAFMALTADESALFQEVVSLRYRVTEFAASGLVPNDVRFFADNAFASRLNHVNAWQNSGPTRPFVAYQIAAWDAPSAAVASTLEGDVAAEAGSVDAVLREVEWDYFPHVTTAALNAGFYAKIAALQGDHHTFYVGSTLGFETVEHAAEQAQALIEAHFPPATQP